MKYSLVFLLLGLLGCQSSAKTSTHICATPIGTAMTKDDIESFESAGKVTFITKDRKHKLVVPSLNCVTQEDTE